MAEQSPSTTFHCLRWRQLAISPDGYLRPPQTMECNKTSPKSIEDYVRRSAQFGYGSIGSCCNIPLSEVASTSRRPRRLLEATSDNGMQQHKSKNHWRLYEKKCPVQLWQNNVLVQHSSPWRCLNKVSAPTPCWGHLIEWNATTEVQNPFDYMLTYNYYATNIQLVHNYHTTAIHLLYNSSKVSQVHYLIMNPMLGFRVSSVATYLWQLLCSRGTTMWATIWPSSDFGTQWKDSWSRSVRGWRGSIKRDTLRALFTSRKINGPGWRNTGTHMCRWRNPRKWQWLGAPSRHYLLSTGKARTGEKRKRWVWRPKFVHRPKLQRILPQTKLVPVKLLLCDFCATSYWRCTFLSPADTKGGQACQSMYNGSGGQTVELIIDHMAGVGKHLKITVVQSIL
jgi:hypothetical protein